MKDDVLELFRDEIPELNELAVAIRAMLSNSRLNLEDVRECITDHLATFQGDCDDDEKLREAGSVAYDVVDILIADLEEDETNHRRIKNYISSYHSYNGFNRLIVDFHGFVSDEERKRLIDEGRRIFVSELTEHWE
jgi:hypothetical protein